MLIISPAFLFFWDTVINQLCLNTNRSCSENACNTYKCNIWAESSFMLVDLHTVKCLLISILKHRRTHMFTAPSHRASRSATFSRLKSCSRNDLFFLQLVKHNNRLKRQRGDATEYNIYACLPQHVPSGVKCEHVLAHWKWICMFQLRAESWTSSVWYRHQFMSLTSHRCVFGYFSVPSHCRSESQTCKVFKKTSESQVDFFFLVTKSVQNLDCFSYFISQDSQCSILSTSHDTNFRVFLRTRKFRFFWAFW